MDTIGNSLIKEAIAPLWLAAALVGSAATGATGGYLLGSSNLPIVQQQQQQSLLNNPKVLVGGLAGYTLGPKMLQGLDEQTARITGTITGGMIGSML